MNDVCEGCELGVCHNHGSLHIPNCWPCVLAPKHSKGCYCSRGAGRGRQEASGYVKRCLVCFTDHSGRHESDCPTPAAVRARETGET